MIRVKAVPGASRDRIVGAVGDSLKIQVAAPPERGRANESIIRLLAECLDLPTRRLSVARGQSQPRKQILVEGLELAVVAERLRVL